MFGQSQGHLFGRSVVLSLETKITYNNRYQKTEMVLFINKIGDSEMYYSTQKKRAVNHIENHLVGQISNSIKSSENSVRRDLRLLQLNQNELSIIKKWRV